MNAPEGHSVNKINKILVDYGGAGDNVMWIVCKCQRDGSSHTPASKPLLSGFNQSVEYPTQKPPASTMASRVCIFAFWICLSCNFPINQNPTPINNAKNITKMTMLDILLNPLARAATGPDRDPWWCFGRKHTLGRSQREWEAIIKRDVLSCFVFLLKR